MGIGCLVGFVIGRRGSCCCLEHCAGYQNVMTSLFSTTSCYFSSIPPLCSQDIANLSLNDNDGSSGASDQDTLAPLPLPGATPWPMMHAFPYQYPHPYSTQPPPYHELSSYSYAPGSTGSQPSEGAFYVHWSFVHTCSSPIDVFCDILHKLQLPSRHLD